LSERRRPARREARAEGGEQAGAEAACAGALGGAAEPAVLHVADDLAGDGGMHEGSLGRDPFHRRSYG
jgi:hypothetical protein